MMSSSGSALAPEHSLGPSKCAATLGVAAALLLAACQGDFELSGAQLRDPKACASCHPDHYREWSGSMHAYASADPVFIAMNARGQRETNGALGDFCVSCHAPLAVRTGKTKDGLNLKDLPDHLQGITCYFCHSVRSVDGTHNNPLRLADDGVLRGGLKDSAAGSAHATAYSTLHDGRRLESARLCGSCHDIVTPKGVHLERTFHEWRQSLFSNPDVVSRLTCGECHMKARAGLAAQVAGVGLRNVHDHKMPGVDVALTPFPERDAQRRAVENALGTTVAAQLCVTETAAGAKIVVTLENIGAGHSWPSGATQDRRAWVEVIAYGASTTIFSTGDIGEGESVTARRGPNLWTLGDTIFGSNGREAHMFWEAVSYRSNLLPSPSFRGGGETHQSRTWLLPALPTRVTLRLRLRPVGLDVIDDLIKSGDLDTSLRAKIPTFTLKGTQLEWRQGGKLCVPEA